jgi:site-specific DNA recombinase
MTKRVALYARVSTDDQRENYSISTQVEGCVRHAQSRGYAIVGDRFVDRATGRDAVGPGNGAVRAYVDDYTSRELSRPALDAALSFLQTTGFDVLVVLALDRFARDPYIRTTLEREFQKCNATVEYVQGNYDDSPEGEVRKDLDATFGKWENAKRVERFNRGKCRKAEQGLFVAGTAPYGYIIDRTAPGGLRIVEQDAAVVRRIFWMCVDGCSIQEIGKVLTAEGVPTARRGAKWAQSSLHVILTNPIYAGWGFYNKRRSKGKGKEPRQRDEWIRFETQPLVERWLFEQVQQRLDENRRAKRRRPTRFYLLTGMVFCELCRRPYGSSTAPAGQCGRAHDAQAYRHKLSQGHCRNHSISARILNPLVWNEIEAVLRDPERLLLGYQASMEQREHTIARRRDSLETLERRAVALGAKLSNLTAAYLDPDISMPRDEYLGHRRMIEDESAELSSKIDEVRRELDAVPEPVDLQVLETYITKIRAAITEAGVMTPEVQRQVLETLMVRVWVQEDRTLRLEGWIGPPIEGLSLRPLE